MSAINSSANESIVEMDRLSILEKELGELSKRLTGFILNNKILKKRVSELGVVVQSYGIVAVHRLGKSTVDKNRSVIVRFLNRKHAYSCLKNSKKLSTSSNASMKKIFITENLCPSNKNLFNYLYKLKKDSKMKSVWSFNGIVYFKLSVDTSERPIRVHH